MRSKSPTCYKIKMTINFSGFTSCSVWLSLSNVLQHRSLYYPWLQFHWSCIHPHREPYSTVMKTTSSNMGTTLYRWTFPFVSPTLCYSKSRHVLGLSNLESGKKATYNTFSSGPSGRISPLNFERNSPQWIRGQGS